MMKKLFLTALAVATLSASSAFAAQNAREGDVTVTIRGQGLQNEGSKRITKKRGFGGEAEVAYFVSNNVATTFGVGYNRFQSKTPDVGLAGTRMSYIPVKLGVQYHIMTANEMDPYLGFGFQYVNANYRTKNNGTVIGGTFRKRKLYGIFFQAGTNIRLADSVAFNINIEKSLMSKHSINTNAGLTPETTKIKYAPWTLGAGLTFDLNNN
jgi:outer membrane protein W